MQILRALKAASVVITHIASLLPLDFLTGRPGGRSIATAEMTLDAQREFDVVIVGSGATGGWAAKVFAEAGLDVVVLEAGPPTDPGVRRGPRRVSELRRLLGMRVHSSDLNSNLAPDAAVEPYVTLPARPFRWVRMRGIGGRTLGWSRVLLRLSDREFKAGRRDGASPDWPISYADLAPHYEEVEAFLGVHGNADGLEQLPDGVYRPAIELTPAELRLKATIEKGWPGRRLVAARGVLDDGNGRGGSSASTTLPAALATGRTHVVTDAFVRCVTIDEASGRVRGVTMVDRRTRRDTEVRARLVALCASTIETTRILLNSRGPRHPQGLGNSSGRLGLGLMDHTATFIRGLLPAPRRIARAPSGGPHGFIIPRFRNLDSRDGDGFVRGYGVQGTAQRAAFGEPFAPFGWVSFRMTALGETLPRRENRVTLDPAVRDAFGIPVARIEYGWTDNETHMVEDARRTMREMVRAAGGVVLSETKGMSVPGQAVHEVGTAPMGADAGSSVVDPFNRCWDAPNVLVLDGAAWPTCGWQNPTLTMMALTVRACRQAVHALRHAR